MEQSDIKQAVKTFLDAHRKAVFSTVDEEGNPDSSLMLYVADDDFNVYFGTKKSSNKCAHMARNPHISVTVMEGCVDPLKVTNFFGVAEELLGESFDTWLEYFKSKNPSVHYVRGDEDFVLYRVTPSKIVWLDASSGKLTKSEIEL